MCLLCARKEIKCIMNTISCKPQTLIDIIIFTTTQMIKLKFNDFNKHN